MTKWECMNEDCNREKRRMALVIQELWEHLTPEARHELNKKYAALNLQSKTDREQRTQKKGE